MCPKRVKLILSISYGWHMLGTKFRRGKALTVRTCPKSPLCVNNITIGNSEPNYEQCCWWLYDEPWSMITSVSRCWRKNHYEGYFMSIKKDVTNISNRSPTSETCHQHKLSPTSETNIDVKNGTILTGYIDVGDSCWRPNVLVTSLRCWWPIYYIEKKSPT